MTALLLPHLSQVEETEKEAFFLILTNDLPKPINKLRSYKFEHENLTKEFDRKIELITS